RSHAQHDPAEYVPQEMVEYWKARDPIARYEEYLTANKLWNEKVGLATAAAPPAHFTKAWASRRRNALRSSA
ncbi:MAG: hypothetical protein M1453_07150, partial [Acidobacteria bacterium]|nr:hypothetical protein [Acidobacteriota bacterium]